ncbi:MAG TPA: hypothetical protein VGF29_06970 [Hyphomicrobiaceae bacterium]|jgi:hypothetical protein
MPPQIWDLARRLKVDDLTMAERFCIRPWEQIWLEPHRGPVGAMLHDAAATVVLERMARFDCLRGLR